MLGRQQRLILLVEKDQQVLQMGKTIFVELLGPFSLLQLFSSCSFIYMS
jgi:hypothetical protein